jgi:hypothetical protein
MSAAPGPIPADYEPVTGGVRQIEVTSAQLHGRACVVCGCELDGLVDAGFVYTPAGLVYASAAADGRLRWPAKACPQHAGPLEAAA